MDKEVYLIRHGRTNFNKLGIWQGSGVDSALDEEGLKQAHLFYQRYKNEGFDLVVHSSLLRSKQSVQAFVEEGIPVVEKASINEISWGHHEGKPHTDASIKEYRSVVAAWSEERYDVSFKGGESANNLKERIDEFVEWLSNEESTKVLVCSHGRAIRALLCIMKGEPLKEMEKYKHHNTGLFKAKYSNGRYLFSDLNNIDHLAEM